MTPGVRCGVRRPAPRGRSRGPGGPGSRRVSNWSSGSSVGGGLVDDHPVAAGDRGQPGGHVDRRAEDVAEPHHDRAAGEAEPDVGHPRVAPDDVDDPLGDVVAPATGSSFTNSTESPRLLMIRPRVRGDHVGAAGLEDLDEVADLVARRGSLDSAVKADDVGEADGDLGGVEVLVLGAERLDPGHRGGEVAAPGVDAAAARRAR